MNGFAIMHWIIVVASVVFCLTILYWAIKLSAKLFSRKNK
jgi:hypothetical protein